VRYAEIETVDKRKNTSGGKQEAPLITLKEILRRRKDSEENSDRLLRRKWWGNIVFFSKDTNRSSEAGNMCSIY
jgi:hypothetical protein